MSIASRSRQVVSGLVALACVAGLSWLALRENGPAPQGTAPAEVARNAPAPNTPAPSTPAPSTTAPGTQTPGTETPGTPPQAPVAQSAPLKDTPGPDKPVLTVYTYSSFTGKYGPGKRVKEAFEATCACTLAYVSADDAGSLVGRLKLEGEATKAEVVLGIDMNLIAESKATGLFVRHGQDISGLSLPLVWTDEVFMPFDWGHLAFIHDSTKLATPPASLKELVDNPNGPRVVLQDPRTSAPGLGFLLWMRQVYGPEADAAWERLKPRVVTFTKGWSEAYGLFLKGEADMVLSYATSPAYHIGAEKKTQFKAAEFSEGHYVHIETAAMTRLGEKNLLARQFMLFVLSERFQAAMPEGNWMMPARTPPQGLPPSFADVIRPAKTLLFTPEEVQANRRAFIDGWLAATSK